LNPVIFKLLTIKESYGREMYELVQDDHDCSWRMVYQPVITHRFPVKSSSKAFCDGPLWTRRANAPSHPQLDLTIKGAAVI